MKYNSGEGNDEVHKKKLGSTGQAVSNGSRNQTKGRAYYNVEDHITHKIKDYLIMQ